MCETRFTYLTAVCMRYWLSCEVAVTWMSDPWRSEELQFLYLQWSSTARNSFWTLKAGQFFEKLRTIYLKKHSVIPEELVPKHVWLCSWWLWRMWRRN